MCLFVKHFFIPYTVLYTVTGTLVFSCALSGTYKCPRQFTFTGTLGTFKQQPLNLITDMPLLITAVLMTCY